MAFPKPGPRQKILFSKERVLGILCSSRCPPACGRLAMASPDLDAPAWVSYFVAAKSPAGFLRCCVPAILVFSFTFAGAAQCRAQDQKDQDVAEAARQERARKQSQPRKSKHVYTAEDLKREHILTPEDRAEMEARKNQPTLADPLKSMDARNGPATAPQSNAESLPADAPLGDVARRFRQQKESQKLQRSAEFHLPFSETPVLASPKPPVQPLHPTVNVRPPVTMVNPAPPVVAPLRPPVRRSPFERPRILPPVAVPPRTFAPAPAPRAQPTPPVRVAPVLSMKLTMVTVKPGDSLWKFAATRLGNGRRWQELLALNPGLRDPDLLRVGSELILPVSVSPGHTTTKYTVRHGDTLWSIAQAHLGHASSWPCIAHANPALRDANFIQEGQILVVPVSCRFTR